MSMPWRNFKRFSTKVLKQPLYAARVAGKRTGAYFSYYGRNGGAGAPEAITLFLTHRCNLRCKMCGQWGESGVTRNNSGNAFSPDMSIDDLKKIIDDIAEFRPNITLFGGEPLLYPHIQHLIQYIKAKDMHCLAITNGSIVDRLAHTLVENGLDELNVSVDGSGELHDSIRGKPGLFDKVVSGLKKVNMLKISQNMKKPLINLQCTISKDNYQQLEQMIEVAEKIGVDSLTFHNLIFLSRDAISRQHVFDQSLQCSSANWNGFVFEPFIDPNILHAKMNDVVKIPRGFPVDFYPNFSPAELREYYQNPSYSPGRSFPGCKSPWVVGYVFPDGELRPCLNIDYSFGNLKENKISELWNGERALKFRRTLKENRMFPACIRCTELYRY